jgi:hypothetical protein
MNMDSAAEQFLATIVGRLLLTVVIVRFAREVSGCVRLVARD